MRKLSNWLKAYLDYTEEQEAPRSFHLWTGLSLIAAALRRNVYLDMGQYTIYPNLFVVMVAVSGACRKTSGAEIGLRIFQAMNKSDLVSHTYNVVTQQITPEGIIKQMSDWVELAPDGKTVILDGSMFLFADELRVLLSDSRAKDLVPLMTKLYDCPKEFEYVTKTYGRETATNVCLNFVACSIPKWLGLCLQADAQACGFTGRIIFVVEDGGHKNLRPVRNLQLEEQLIHDLAQICRLRGAFTWAPGTYDKVDRWYHALTVPVDDEELVGWYSRYHVHVLKVAMLLAAAEGDDLMIDDARFEAALEMIKKVEGRRQEAFMYVAATREAEIGDRILRHLTKAKGWVQHAVALRNVYKYVRDAREFGLIMEGLDERGAVQRIVTNKGMYYCLLRYATQPLPTGVTRR